jgi:Carbohydrate-selective porin, OprB family
MPIAELAYSFDEEPISSTRLTDVKLGAWYHTGDFPDQRRDSLGRSLADPASNGIPAMHSSNFGAYLVVDKMLSRRPDTATQGLAAFLRVGYAPPDRNLISLEVGRRPHLQGPFPEPRSRRAWRRCKLWADWLRPPLGPG